VSIADQRKRGGSKSRASRHQIRGDRLDVPVVVRLGKSRVLYQRDRDLPDLVGRELLVEACLDSVHARVVPTGILLGFQFHFLQCQNG
jgi:hypothetical protein